MNALDLEALIVSLARDAELLGCARPEQLQPNLPFLETALDELSRAVEKARERIAA